MRPIFSQDGEGESQDYFPVIDEEPLLTRMRFVGDFIRNHRGTACQEFRDWNKVMRTLNRRSSSNAPGDAFLHCSLCDSSYRSQSSLTRHVNSDDCKMIVSLLALVPIPIAEPSSSNSLAPTTPRPISSRPRIRNQLGRSLGSYPNGNSLAPNSASGTQDSLSNPHRRLSSILSKLEILEHSLSYDPSTTTRTKDSFSYVRSELSLRHNRQIVDNSSLPCSNCGLCMTSAKTLRTHLKSNRLCEMLRKISSISPTGQISTPLDAVPLGTILNLCSNVFLMFKYPFCVHLPLRIVLIFV